MSTFLRSRQPFVRAWHLWALLLLAPCCGCQKKEPLGGPRATTVPVIGKALIDGKPVLGTSIILVPTDRAQYDAVASSSGKPVPSATAYVEPDGTFKIGTYVSGDGAAPGEYVATFEWGTPRALTGEYSGDKFRGKYKDPKKSQITVKVPESGGPVDMGTIELSSK